jgi:hypothetical protein
MAIEIQLKGAIGAQTIIKTVGKPPREGFELSSHTSIVGHANSAARMGA